MQSAISLDLLYASLVKQAHQSKSEQLLEHDVEVYKCTPWINVPLVRSIKLITSFTHTLFSKFSLIRTINMCLLQEQSSLCPFKKMKDALEMWKVRDGRRLGDDLKSRRSAVGPAGKLG